jgi:dihydroxy-acid dehydratase
LSRFWKNIFLRQAKTLSTFQKWSQNCFRTLSYGGESSDKKKQTIVTCFEGYSYDGCITIPGCDKNMPGSIMGMIRANRPGLMVYGGTIRAGKYKNEDVNIVSAFESYGTYLKGEITAEEREDLLSCCCPGNNI